jgi:hypothetical protein
MRRIVIRDSVAKRYAGKMGGWVTSIMEARNFASTTEAIAYGQQQACPGEIIVMDGDPPETSHAVFSLSDEAASLFFGPTEPC